MEAEDEEREEQSKGGTSGWKTAHNKNICFTENTDKLSKCSFISLNYNLSWLRVSHSWAADMLLSQQLNTWTEFYNSEVKQLKLMLF